MVKRMRMRGVRTLASESVARLAGLVVLSLLMLGVALADEADPPGRVARLSYVQGSVSLQPAGQEDWVGAEPNRPLTTNDKLWSDTSGSRAELDIGGAVIRVGSNTGFSFLNLDDSVAQMQVTAGTVVVRVRELLENQTYEVDTPNVAVLLDQPGMYRVDVSDSGDSTVVRVSDGQAEASNGGQSMPIYNQQMVNFTGTGDQLSANAGGLGSPDGFDDWSFERDREYDQSPSRQYVADDIAGAEDLDENGQWENTPDYGPVWMPTAVAAGWAPYSFGHWAWISPWGWTWVDNASWGFAPFHYGRWAQWHDRWCWVPGPRRARAVYAPAMVAWVGGSAGAAGVAWFPLGPREVYVPSYRVSDRYVRTVNITNTTIVDHTYITSVYQNRATNIHYVNSRVPGAVTSVSRTVFTSAQPVNAHRMRLPPSELARVSVNTRPPEMAPVRQSFLGGATHGYGRRPPQALMNRDVVARTAPPAATAARVRVVGQPRPANREGFGGGRGPSMEQRAGASPSMQQARPGFSTPPPRNAPEDNRSWADRAHALGQPSLPPSQGPRYQPPQQQERAGVDANPGQGRFESNGSPREFTDRPPPGFQPGRAEPQRPSMNNYTRPQPENRPQFENRPQMENRSGEERGAMPQQQAPAARFAEPPSNRYAAPPPASVPSNRYAAPPQAPVPQQHYAAPPSAPVPSSPAAAPPPRMAPAPQAQPQQQQRGQPAPQNHGPTGRDPRRN